MKRVGILGSRELSYKILQWIIEQDNVNIIGVVTPPFNGWWDDKLKNIAEHNNLKVFNSIEELIKQQPDILFSINYWKTISKKHINLVKEGIINIHHSYLLKYRGRYSTSWAIINSDKNNKTHGTTLHYITPKLDEGPIIDSRKCIINDLDTAESLFIKVEDLAFNMFKDNFNKIINNKITKLLNPDSDYYFYDKNSNQNLKIKYGISQKKLYNFVRAWTFKDRPKPYFIINGKKIILEYEK